MKERSNYFDNIKGLLTILVIIGHIMQPYRYHFAERYLYLFIYLFHMPLFLFINGYFFREERQKTGIVKILTLYIIEQPALYFLTNNCSFNDFTFFEPAWPLWYLFSIILYYLILPLFKTEDNKEKIIYLALSVFTAMVIGFDKQVNSFFSLSKIICFFPFILSGYFMKEIEIEKKIDDIRKSSGYLRWVFVSIIGIMLISAILVPFADFSSEWILMTGSYPVNDMIFPVLRGFIFISAAIISIFIMLVMTKKRNILTYCGRYSTELYLLHPFFVLLMREII